MYRISGHGLDFDEKERYCVALKRYGYISKEKERVWVDFLFDVVGLLKTSGTLSKVATGRDFVDYERIN